MKDPTQAAGEPISSEDARFEITERKLLSPPPGRVRAPTLPVVESSNRKRRMSPLAAGRSTLVREFRHPRHHLGETQSIHGPNNDFGEGPRYLRGRSPRIGFA